jgi:hypothetical protein
MKAYYVYTHAAAGRVFYVGCATTNFNKRGERAKRGRAYSTLGHTPSWHAAAAGGYDVAVVFESDARDDAFEREVSLIAELRGAGHPLVNIARGGAGCPGVTDSDEVRRKKSITKLGALNPMHGKTGALNPNSRKVRDKTSGTVYDSVQLAADAKGFKMKTLYNWLSGHRPNPTSLELA